MRKIMMAMGLCAVLAGCGGGTLRTYKGTQTDTFTANGATNTTTTTGAVFNVESSVNAGDYLFLDGTSSYTATSNGGALTFAAGQGISVTETNPAGMRSVTLSTGTGSLTNEQLSLNLTGTVTNGGTGTYSLTFTGTRQ